MKPILDGKCAGCHASYGAPFYASVPGIRGDIEAGRAKFDVSDGFPFNASTTPAAMVGDADGLENTIYENTMPPSQYILVHWDSNLTDSERTVITSWTRDVTLRLGAFVPRAASDPPPGSIRAGQICAVNTYVPGDEQLERSIPAHWEYVDRPGACDGSTCQEAGSAGGREVKRCKP